MKKLAFLALLFSTLLAQATIPCARYTITPIAGTILLNGHAITGETDYHEGDTVSTTWIGGCAPYPGEITAHLKGYVFITPNTWAFSHAVDLQLPSGCESDYYILHGDATPNCSASYPSATPIGVYCPCNGGGGL